MILILPQSVLFNWCVRHHYCLENPCDRLDKLPRDMSQIAALSLEESKRLLYAAMQLQDSEKALLDLVARQLEKADPNATAKDLRRYGTLGMLRHAIKDRGVALRLSQFKPDHALNPESLAAYAGNRLRVAPELRYSPHAKYPVLASGDAHRELMTQFLANKAAQTGFARLLLEMLGTPA